MRPGDRRPRWWSVVVGAAATATVCAVAAGCANDDAADDPAAGDASQPSVAGAPSTTPPPPAISASTTAHPSTDVVGGSTAPTRHEPPTIDELLARGETRPLAIAHQGGDAVYPSSTLFAYGEAVRHGVDMLELDVHLSADGQLVVLHDTTVDRTTEATGAVADMTAAQLAALDAAYDFTPECRECPRPNDRRYPYRGMRTGDRPPPPGYVPDDFAIPTLRQIVERFPQMPLDIEIKDGVGTVEPLVAELRALARVRSSVVVSFDQAVVDAVRATAPDIAVSPGEDALVAYAGGAPLDGYRVVQVPPAIDDGDVDVLELIGDRLRRDGIAVWVWIDDPYQETARDYRQLLDRDIDGLIIGRPDVTEAVFTR